MTQATNVRKVDGLVTRGERAKRNGHVGSVIWLTGLSGAGKSTLAIRAERSLVDLGWQALVLDGDNLRMGLNSDLGFSEEDRVENIRRAGEVAALFAAAGHIAIAAFISPYRRDRHCARACAERSATFHEVFLNAPLETCEQRDVKGLYKRARSGELPNFTGITAPYEVPLSPDLVIETATAGIDACVARLMSHVLDWCAA